MDFENGRPLQASDIPKVLIGFAVVLAFWPAVFPPSHPLLARERLQEVAGTLHRVERSDPVRDRGNGMDRPMIYYPGTVELTVETSGGLRHFALDSREAARSPRLAELRPGDDVSLLVEPVPSGQDRLWELRRGEATIVDYAVTRAYVSEMYGQPVFWLRCVAGVLALAAMAGGWRLRASRSGSRRRAPHALPDDDLGPAREVVFTRPPPTYVPEPDDAPEDRADIPYVPAAFDDEPATIPPVLSDVAGTHPVPVLLALLLDERAERRVAQRERIGEALGVDVLESLKAMAPAIGRLPPKLLPALADLALPALEGQPGRLLAGFADCVDAMAVGDGLAGVYRYCLGRIIRARLAPAGAPAAESSAPPTPSASRTEIARLLSTLARFGHDRVEAAERAYAAGMRLILPGEKPVYAPPAGSIRALDSVWGPLRALAPEARRKVVEAVIETIDSDGKATPAESQLLHAVCALLDCPVPA